MITVIVFSLISFIRFTPGTPYNPSKSVQKIPAWKPDTPTIDTLRKVIFDYQKLTKVKAK